jgi:hypothetical protein
MHMRTIDLEKDLYRQAINNDTFSQKMTFTQFSSNVT